MKKCQECGKEYEGNFCPYCGAKWTEEQATERICPDCGEKVAPGMRFCANCGYDFSKKKSSDEIKAEKRMQAAMLRTANFVEAIPTMLRVGNGVLSVIFSALLWILFALPVTSILGENIGNLYQFMSGTTILGELLEPMAVIGWVIFLAVVTMGYAAFALYLLIVGRKDEKAYTKHNIYNLAFLVFHIVFFVVGCIVRSKVSDYGLNVGACANALMICSAIFFVLSLALSIVSCILLEKAKAPLTPEEVAAKEARKAALIEKAKKIAKPVGTVGALALVVLIIVGISTNIFRAGKVDNIAIGADEATVVDILGEPYSRGVSAEYAQADHDSVWKYYSKNYTEIYDKIAELEEKAENMLSLGALAGILEEGLALEEKALALRYKYIEVAFKDGTAVAVYLDKDRCDLEGEEEKAKKSNKVTFEPFEYNGCIGGGYGKAQLTVKYADGSYANDIFRVEMKLLDQLIIWSDFKGEHSYSSNSEFHVLVGKTQHRVDEWEKINGICMEGIEKTGKCVYCHNSVSETIYFTEHQNQNGTCSECSMVLSLGDSTYVRADADGKKDANGSYILFGEYPQTLKAESVTITSTQDARGYYLGSDGFYYAKVIADPYDSNYRFQNGTSVTSGNTYYFKVEPIRWRILSESDDTALILCDSIIENKQFNDDWYNNYADSTIRAWLNDQFYNTAFGDLQKNLVNTVLVDNSAASTGDLSNPYACEDTNDNVFLLSYKEVKNPDYGFASSYSPPETARRMTVSEYARAMGAHMSDATSSYGEWLLRSPHPYDEESDDLAFVVNFDGCVDNIYVTERCGVVPALQIRLN